MPWGLSKFTLPRDFNDTLVFLNMYTVMLSSRTSLWLLQWLSEHIGLFRTSWTVPKGGSTCAWIPSKLGLDQRCLLFSREAKKMLQKLDSPDWTAQDLIVNECLPTSVDEPVGVDVPFFIHILENLVEDMEEVLWWQENKDVTVLGHNASPYSWVRLLFFNHHLTPFKIIQSGPACICWTV